jgi:hypothetical protein
LAIRPAVACSGSGTSGAPSSLSSSARHTSLLIPAPSHSAYELSAPIALINGAALQRIDCIPTAADTKRVFFSVQVTTSPSGTAFEILPPFVISNHLPYDAKVRLSFASCAMAAPPAAALSPNTDWRGPSHSLDIDSSAKRMLSGEFIVDGVPDAPPSISALAPSDTVHEEFDILRDDTLILYCLDPMRKVSLAVQPQDYFGIDLDWSSAISLGQLNAANDFEDQIVQLTVRNLHVIFLYTHCYPFPVLQN